MNIKFFNSGTKKLICIIAAITVLATSLPLSTLFMASAAGAGDIIDFQDVNAGDIVDGNDHFSIGGQDNEDKEYFYASNATDETTTLTVEGLQLQEGKKYTVDMDIYTFGLSKDSENKMFGIKIYGGSEASTETFVYNKNALIEEWTNFHFSFTAKQGSDKLDFSAFTSARAIIEDFAITDEDGNNIAIDFAAACDAYGKPDEFAFGTLKYLTGEDTKANGPTFNGDPDYAIYFDNNIDNDFWLTALGMGSPNLPAGNTYTVEFDVYALTKGDNVVFNGVKAHFNTSHSIPGGQVWKEEPSELNVWTNYSFNITTTDTLGGVYIHVLGDDFKGYLDNFKIKDGTGSVIFEFAPDADDFDKTSNCAKVVKLPKEMVAQTYPAYKLTMDKGEIFRTTDNSCANEIKYSFDYYLMKGAVTAGSANVGGLDTVLEAGAHSCTITGDSNTKSLKLTATEKSVIYIWNLKIVTDGQPQQFANRTDRTTCEFEEITFSDIPGANYNDAEDSNNGGSGATPPAQKIPGYKLEFDGNGTKMLATKAISHSQSIGISFDYYRPGDQNVRVDFRNGNAQGGAYYKMLEQGVHSISLTAPNSESAGADSWRIFSTKDTEIYIYNVKVFADGVEVPFEIRADRTTCTVTQVDNVPLPEGSGGAAATPPEDNYVMLVDTTSVADNGSANKSFWFNELGMPGYGGKLQSGKKYTVSFDVYPIKMPTSGNLFHFRTANGQQNGDTWAGFWKPDLQLNKWQNTTNTFTVADGAKGGNHILFVYGGFKGYIDNFKLLDENGNEVAGTGTNFTSLTVPTKHVNYLTIEKEKTNTPSKPSGPNYAIYIDNSANDIQSGQIWFNLLGAPQMNIAPGKTYTLKFDNYALNESFRGHCYVGVHNTGGGITGQNWWDTSDTLNGWASQSVNFTVSGDKALAYHTLYVGAGFKGYLDNFRVFDGNTEVAKLEFDETNEGKTSSGATVVKLPNKINPDYVPSANLSGLEIAVLKGKAEKDGASIKLGGAKSPLTIESNKTYKLSFKYYQANPTASGELNLFGIKPIASVIGKDNGITWFKKNNADGWTEVKLIFSTGTITDASADWFEIVLNPNAWVYFDDFAVEETEIDNNKEVSKITFENKDDSIYPYFKQAECVFEQSSDFGGTFKAVNATEYTNTSKNSNQTYTFKGIKMKSNTTYKVSLDYYVENPFTDYAAAFGYSKNTLGIGSDNHWTFINNIQSRGWHTVSFTVTTGEVTPNANYFNLVCYDVNDSSEPRTLWFDNFTLTEQYQIETLLNDETLGTVTKSHGVKAGDDTRVVANAFAGATFEGWYEYGDLVSTNKTYRLTNVSDNHKLEARFSGEAKPSTTVVQGFEDYELGDIVYEWYEIVNDPKNVLEGKQSLHIKPDRINETFEASIFFPVIANSDYQLKDGYTYDVYMWVKPAKKAESTTYTAFLGSDSCDQSDMLESGQYSNISVSLNIKPGSDGKEVATKNGWYRYLLGTVTKEITTRDGFAFQICKFHANRGEGASIDDFYLDCVEVVERTPDFANLKYTEKFFNEISNPNFEEKITEDNWGPLTDGASVEKVTKKEHDWQQNYQFKFDAAASNGKEYVRVVPISKQNRNYTFAAWTKLSKGSDITVGLYSNGNYVPFESIMNGETGKLALKDDGKWNRVNFSFNSGDKTEAYLVIKGTKGTLELDMVNLFIAERGFKEDPNTYGDSKLTFVETDPIAFPDKITTEEVLVEEGQEATNNKKYLITRQWVGPNMLVIILSIVGGVLVLAGAATVLIIVLVKKRKKN